MATATMIKKMESKEKGKDTWLLLTSASSFIQGEDLKFQKGLFIYQRNGTKKFTATFKLVKESLCIYDEYMQDVDEDEEAN